VRGSGWCGVILPNVS